MPTEDIKFVDILHNPHFSQFAALISVPFRSYRWRQKHPKVPFWTLLKACSKRLDEASFANQHTRTEFISAFTSLITTLVEADPRLYYRIEDMDWFVEIMNGSHALVTMSMLFAAASSKPSLVTPAQIAEATNTAESTWRNKAASGEIIGAVKYGKQWLIPTMSLRAYGINVEIHGQEIDEDSEEDLEGRVYDGNLQPERESE